MTTEADIQHLVEQIVAEFHPDRVVLFGSRSRADARPDSDVDLLVILPFEGSVYRKSAEILARTLPPFTVDILARRPEDTRRRYELGDPLIREALDRGRVLYEKAA